MFKYYQEQACHIMVSLATTGNHGEVAEITKEVEEAVDSFYAEANKRGLVILVPKSRLRIFQHKRATFLSTLFNGFTATPHSLGCLLSVLAFNAPTRICHPIWICAKNKAQTASHLRKVIWHEMVHAVLGIVEHGIGWYAPTNEDFDLFDNATVWDDIQGVQAQMLRQLNGDIRPEKSA